MLALTMETWGRFCEESWQPGSHFHALQVRTRTIQTFVAVEKYYTVDQEIIAIQNFSLVAWVVKIKRAKV